MVTKTMSNEGWTAAELAAIGQSATRRRFAEGALVLDFDDVSNDVYFIVSGEVRVVVRTPNGEEMLLAHLGAGECFGETAAIDGSARSANVTATSNAEMIMVPAATFLETVHSTPAVCQRLLRVLTRRIRDLNERLFQRNVLDVRHRLYADLLRLARPRAGHAEQRILSPPPPHHDLAARIGCRREQVSRELSAMEADGLAEKHKGGLVLLHPTELTRRVAAATGASRAAG